MAPDEERARNLAMDKRIAELSSQDSQQAVRLSELAAALEKHAPAGFDPASDDMTVQFAVKLAEKDAEIERLRAAEATAYERGWNAAYECSRRGPIGWYRKLANGQSAGDGT